MNRAGNSVSRTGKVSGYQGVPGVLPQLHVALVEAIAGERPSELRNKVEAILADLHEQLQFEALAKAWSEALPGARRMFQAELAKDAQFNLEDVA